LYSSLSENVKAYFRRGKAHIGAWNPSEAREDLHRAEQLDPSLAASVRQLLHRISEIEKERNAEDRRRLSTLFSGKV
jgi:AH receptor-interacting protein